MMHKIGLTNLPDFEILWFVTFVHLLFSVGSLDLFVASLVFMKGTSCCVLRRNLKYSIEPLDRGGAMVNFKRS